MYVIIMDMVDFPVCIFSLKNVQQSILIMVAVDPVLPEVMATWSCTNRGSLLLVNW